MKKIKIISIGSLSPLFKALFVDYSKNIQHFCEFVNLELKEFSEIKNIEEKKLKETKLIIENLDKDAKIFLLSLKGKQVESELFAEQIKEFDKINFIIGGSDGMVEDLILNHLKISFSKMTFPHQLFKVMLSEQIYRAFMILNNKKYHK
ncbi:hypothetical protein MCSF7_02356 [Mycoplasmopsis columbina SF7]|uniref:Ribosomal RNA large subunit methyltransferase H n=1 Tax=Mycoplasmopsis columbina SF7 TaxID=1037410 RepID=F9UKQ8_9BACT|nr:23S rRNA (pseudouridine(1915)-N(3))-methyltransferase RlmH [Mycoplasmopsis columbina]EGV00263.1 hypothetical protein MCSF7_02356 [Mycoplasmopsis columbina SF7]